MDPPCTGYHRQVWDLPCSHELLEMLKSGRVLQMENIGRHWHLDHDFPPFNPLSLLRDADNRPILAGQGQRPQQVPLQERTLLEPINIVRGRGRPRGAANRARSEAPSTQSGPVIVTNYSGVPSVVRRPESSTARDLTMAERAGPSQMGRRCSGCRQLGNTIVRCPRNGAREGISQLQAFTPIKKYLKMA
jgi:hypothetical protein